MWNSALKYEDIGESVKYTAETRGNLPSSLIWISYTDVQLCREWIVKGRKGHCDRIQDDFLRIPFIHCQAEWLYAVYQYDITHLSFYSSICFRTESFIQLILQHNNPDVRFSGISGWDRISYTLPVRTVSYIFCNSWKESEFPKMLNFI